MKNKTYEGTPEGSGKRVAVVVSRFNDIITRKLLEGALETLSKQGVREQDLEVAWVPGAWEIPVTARKLAKTGRFDGVIALGAIIRGETTHHEVIGREVSAGLRILSEEMGLPVALGVLTTENFEQALARAGDGLDNKGTEAALHLLETLSVLGQIH